MLYPLSYNPISRGVLPFAFRCVIILTHAKDCQQKSARAKRLFRRGSLAVQQRNYPLAATVLLTHC